MKQQNNVENEQISTNQSEIPFNNYSGNQSTGQNINDNKNQQSSNFVQLNEAFVNQSEISELPLKNYRNVQQGQKIQNYYQNQKFSSIQQSDGFEEIIVNKSQQYFNGNQNYSIPQEYGNNYQYQLQQNIQQVQEVEQKQSDLPLKNYKKINTKQNNDKYEQQINYNKNQSNNYQNQKNNGYSNNYRNSNHQDRQQNNHYYDNQNQNSQKFQYDQQYKYQNNYGYSQNNNDKFNNNQQNQRNQQTNNYYDQQYKNNEVVFKFKTDFLRANNYLDINELRENFVPLKNLNQNHFPLEDSYFVIIRPKVGYFNLHKAIKYGIWTSGSNINKKLSTLYKDSEMKVYLIFLPLGEHCDIVGIAEMTSDYNPDASFKYWDKDGIYIGNFSIIWHYIKNISPKFIPQLKFENGYKRAFFQIEELKDGTQINYDDAINIFYAFQDAPDQPSVFPHFNNLDIQEDQLRFHKQQKSINDQLPIGGKVIKKQYKY